MHHITDSAGIWDQPDRSVDTQEAADVLGVPVRLMERWRQQRKGPRYRKYGGKLVDGNPVGGGLIRYLISDLKAFANSCAVDAKPIEREHVSQELSA